MSSFIPLPIRLAAPQQQQQQQQQPQQPPLQEQQQQQEPQRQPLPSPEQQQPQKSSQTQLPDKQVDDPPGLLSSLNDTEETATPPRPPRPIIPTGNGSRPQDAISNIAQWVQATSGAQPKDNHQFWLNDPNIVESLFTIHRSAKHLLDFTSSLVNSHEPTLGQRPIPLMSNGDVLFMTQLSNDIARSVGGIAAVRHHGSRAAARKRKAREAEERDHDHDHDHGPGPSSVKRAHVHDHSHSHSHRNHQHSPTVPKVPAGAVSSRTAAVPRVGGWGDGEPVCRKCGRTDTPEWRKGPDGSVLCNVCGLIYAKQRRKMKGSHGDRSR
ncbi:GATA zinc finger domain-containing protein 8 [Cytospora mali]|uniref:GATA zinc finger domain-containing protein 8 n=1 Tax=Cytospora mali TaxID=578113 RepID=A0A194VZJ1_CYTMA|nr:GATA zinc finger domain-containing protein 8 [Valsa mali]